MRHGFIHINHGRYGNAHSQLTMRYHRKIWGFISQFILLKTTLVAMVNTDVIYKSWKIGAARSIEPQNSDDQSLGSVLAEYHHVTMIHMIVC